MSDYAKVSTDYTNEQSSDSLNTNSCSSKNSTSINETVNSIKFLESSSGFSTPPTVSADTCDSGFTEFFSSKAGSSNTIKSRNVSSGERPNISDSASAKITNDHDNYSTSDSDSESKWKSDEIAQILEDDTSDSDSSSDFRSEEKVELNRISYRWVEWCHRQLVAGVNPRKILRKIFHNSEFPVPPGISDRELWGRIANFVTQPPERTRLKDVNSIDHAIGLLRTCKNIIVLTGAGVSVSCGIPDFRSKSGIYQRLRSEIPEIADPHEIFDIRFFIKDPRPFFKFAKELFPGSFTPSLCHRFIRLLEKKDKLLRNYSQNIDTLERQVGIEKVVECHGSFATASCTKCNNVVSADEIREHVLAQKIPMCGICNPMSGNGTTSTDDNPPKIISHNSSMTDGYKELYDLGILKPDIVFFGESLPDVFHPAVNADRQKCDLLLVIGSSLKVRPVSLIPEFLRADVPQILINRERVGNYVFDIELLGDADIIVNQLCRMLGDDWTDICEQPELTISETLTFDSDTNETANINVVERTGRIVKPPQPELTASAKSSSDPHSTENVTNDVQDSKSSSTESIFENNVVTNASSELASDVATTDNESTDQLSGSSIEVPIGSCSNGGNQEKQDVDTVTKKVFVFSIENVPSGCYYLSHPNKYVFPGSTHTWYGNGKANDDDDREMFEEEGENADITDDDDDDDDEDDDDEDVEENMLSSTDISDNEDVSRKRSAEIGVQDDNDESVSSTKRIKINDAEVPSARLV